MRRKYKAMLPAALLAVAAMGPLASAQVRVQRLEEENGGIVVAVQAEEDEKNPPAVEIEIESQAVPGIRLAAPAGGFGFPEAIPSGKYMLGVASAPLSDLVRSQLQLENGVVVESALPDTPAAKVLKQHDILLTFNGEKLADMQNLHEAVEKADGKEVEVVLMREGKKKTVKIAAVERPKTFTLRGAPHVQPLPGDAPAWFERLPAEGDIRMFMLRPGVMLPEGEKQPDNLSITVTRKGEEEAKIAVKQGEQEWNISEKELDQLPEEIRPFVDRALGRRLPFTMGLKALRAQKIPDMALPAVRAFRFEGLGKDALKQLENLPPEVRKQIEESLKHLPQPPQEGVDLETLRKELEELRKKVDALEEK